MKNIFGVALTVKKTGTVKRMVYTMGLRTIVIVLLMLTTCSSLTNQNNPDISEFLEEESKLPSTKDDDQLLKTSYELYQRTLPLDRTISDFDIKQKDIENTEMAFPELENELEIETVKKGNNNIENTIEFTGRDYYSEIQPSKTEYNDESSHSGEGMRVPLRGRSLPLTEPNIAISPMTNASINGNSTSRSDDRKSNSDIQEIINGFVKLLNGGPQQGMAKMPSRSRINNRGPPKISDVPPIVFDPPLSSTTTSKHPYPFDIPSPLPPQPANIGRPYLSGVQLPEQIVPSDTQNGNEHKKPINVTKNYDKKNQTESVKGNEKLENVGKPNTISSLPLKPIFQLDPPRPVYQPDSSSQKPISHSNSSTSKPIIQGNLTVLQPVPQNLSTMLSKNGSSIQLNGTSQQHNSSLSSTKGTMETSSIPIKPTSSNSTTNPSVNVSYISSPAIKNLSISASPTTTKPTVASTAIGAVRNISESGGTGSTTVDLEPSTQEISSTPGIHKSTSVPFATIIPSKRPSNPSDGSYFPRPGIVLDDPEYKPGSHRRTAPSIITAPPPRPVHDRDSFDIVVSAIQGPDSTNLSRTGQPYIYPVELDGVQLEGVTRTGDASVITTAESGQNFVSIDGKRTYLNLFDTSSPIAPTHVKPQTTTGLFSTTHISNVKGNTTKASPPWKKPTHPPVRIDTCIVGDDSTCDVTQHERCRTEIGVSSCHCRPGYTRRKHREPCHRIVSLSLTLHVDRMYDHKITWNDKFLDHDSVEYQQLEYESTKAMDSALSMTPFSDLFMGAHVNNIYTLKSGNAASPVYVNMTIQLSESPETLRPAVKQDLQKHMVGVVHRRSNNVGASSLWVDSPANAVSHIQDVDECRSTDLNDCHPLAKCSNVFGSFQCTCPEGYKDPWADNHHRSGRMCETCDPGYCNHRGECGFQNGHQTCKCVGSFYGTQCEIDGEVLGVAIGSSLLAILIIVTTLACLCAWSRRWNNEQKVGSPIFGYMPTGGSTVKTPVIGGPPYQVSLEDRVRWAQIADAMAHANHYGPEPVGAPGRPSSVFGYSLPQTGTILIPRMRAASVHAMRTPESTTSEEEDRDRADLLGRNFHVPRPKSRSSVANQSGIYYDVDYDQQQCTDVFSTLKSGQPCIPLNTYTMTSRSHYYR